jgi:hypothetical protein
MNEHTRDPLPREWLPDAVGPAHPGDEALWEARLYRLAAAAEPALARLRTPAIPWWNVLAAWWRPLVSAAALGTAAAALTLLLYVPPRGAATAPAGTATLSAMVGDGQPAALWAGLGAKADPALALIALQGGER